MQYSIYITDPRIIAVLDSIPDGKRSEFINDTLLSMIGDQADPASPLEKLFTLARQIQVIAAALNKEKEKERKK